MKVIKLNAGLHVAIPDCDCKVFYLVDQRRMKLWTDKAEM